MRLVLADPPASAPETTAPGLTLPPRLLLELRARGARPADLEPVAADGSDRRFFRLRTPDQSFICLYQPHPPGSRVTENDSYFYLGRHLRRCGVPVPAIQVYCREEGWFLMEDLGDCHLQTRIKQTSDPLVRRSLYHQALEILVRLQLAGARGFQPAWCFDTPVYDGSLVYKRECQYFVTAFLQTLLGLPVTLFDLAADFAALIRRAVAPRQRFLLHRDFQSRNLLWHQGRLWVLDFQGARLGPLFYDVAALLLDPYVDLPPAWQEEFLTYYLEILAGELPLDPELARERYQYLALCRNLQILGAYGYLIRVKGKEFFRPYITPALTGLERRLAVLPPGRLPRLRRWVDQARDRWFKNPG